MADLWIIRSSCDGPRFLGACTPMLGIVQQGRWHAPGTTISTGTKKPQHTDMLGFRPAPRIDGWKNRRRPEYGIGTGDLHNQALNVSTSRLLMWANFNGAALGKIAAR